MKISKEQLKGKTAICVAAQNGSWNKTAVFLFQKLDYGGCIKFAFFKDTAVSRRYRYVLIFYKFNDYLGNSLIYGRFQRIVCWFYYQFTTYGVGFDMPPKSFWR